MNTYMLSNALRGYGIFRRTFRLLAEILVAGYLAAFVIAQGIVDGMLFPAPPVTSELTPAAAFVTTASGLHTACREYLHPSSGIYVVFSHGNGEDLDDIAPFLLEAANNLRVNLFAYDYPGYGHSEGVASIKNSNEALNAVIRYLHEKGITDQNIILWGRSVGGGPTLEAARKSSFRGIILQSTFMSAFRVVTGLPLFPFDRYNNLAIIRTLRTPVLVIHGEDDQTIPFHHGQALFNAAAGPKACCWIPHAGHDDPELAAPESYWQAISMFIRSVENSESP